MHDFSIYGILFDMDGVLIDSGEAHFQAWHQLGEEVGVPHTREFFRQTFGMHNAQILPKWLGRKLDEDELTRLADRKEALYRQLVSTQASAIEGAVPLVGELRRQGFRLAVASSGPRANIELCLRALELEDVFDALSTGDDVSEGKPHPEVFLLAARKLGLPPGQCLVIEDAPAGVEAARRAGAACLALTSTRPAVELSAADLVVSKLSLVEPCELVELIDKTSARDQP